ncbi:MAG TPA: DUF2948 family protein [Terricaulis sp.]|nr:DUF2948 family protein [Terricaulis sp.]
MSASLKLLAEDAADLEIIAAAAQDALLRVGEASFDPKTRRFTAVINRFRWETAESKGPYERVRAALSFESVMGVKSRRLRRDAPDALASILSVDFVPDADPPGGSVRVTLAGGGEISLQVECLDALLMDIGPVWPTPRRPDHEAS